MAWKFFYDKYMENEDLTFRVIGRKVITDESGGLASYNQTKNTTKLSDATTILRDVIRDNLRIDIQHSYAYQSPSFTNIVETYKEWIAEMGIKIGSLSTEIQQTLNQARDNPEIILNPEKNTKIYTSSDFYKNFEGTNISIPLQFSMRLFKKKRLDEGNAGSFWYPKEQLAHINSYFLGPYYKEPNAENAYRIYMAPHGYAGAVQQNWDILGTLSLHYGRNTIFDNLLLTNYNFQLSREIGEDGGPLFIDLSFGLIPAIIFTQENLQQLLTASSGGTDVS